MLIDSEKLKVRIKGLRDENEEFKHDDDLWDNGYYCGYRDALEGATDWIDCLETEEEHGKEV